MKTASKTYLYLLVLFVATGLGYAGLELYESRYAELPNYSGPEHSVRSFSFLDDSGQIFNSEEHRDQIWIVHSFFTSCPTICPKLMRTVQSVHNITRTMDDVIILSLTVDPKRDSVARMARYIERFNRDPTRWKLLTGDRAELYRTLRKSFLIAAADGLDDEDGGFIHSENVIILDKNQNIRGIVNGIAGSADGDILDIVAAIRKQQT